MYQIQSEPDRGVHIAHTMYAVLFMVLGTLLALSVPSSLGWAIVWAVAGLLSIAFTPWLYKKVEHKQNKVALFIRVVAMAGLIMFAFWLPLCLS